LLKKPLSLPELSLEYCPLLDCYTNSRLQGALKVMAKSHLKLVTPHTVKRTVTPRRKPNAELRSREYLTEAEIEKLMKAARDNRYGHRDASMILVTYRHGFRASELVDLRWDQIDFDTATMAVRRGQAGHACHASHPRR
jgi:integrase